MLELLLTLPVWVLVAFAGYHFIAAKNRWQFSLRFFLVFSAAEGVALAISMAVWRLLQFLYDMPPPDDLP